MANGSQREDLLKQAASALQTGRPADAARIASGVLKDYPRDQRALQIKGAALLMQGKPTEAVVLLEEAARGRHDPETDTQLAIALQQLGRFDEALPKLRRATKRKPPFPAAFHELGFLLTEMGRVDEAVEALHRGLEVAPMMPELSIQLGYLQLRRGRRADAKAAFARAVSIAPGSLEALDGLGTAHQELGEFQEAAECFRRCLMVRPDDTALRLNLGHCLLLIGQHDAGLDCFRTAGRGDDARNRTVLASLVRSSRGRFWLRPSDAARFFREQKR